MPRPCARRGIAQCNRSVFSGLMRHVRHGMIALETTLSTATLRLSSSTRDASDVSETWRGQSLRAARWGLFAMFVYQCISARPRKQRPVLRSLQGPTVVQTLAMVGQYRMEVRGMRPRQASGLARRDTSSDSRVATSSRSIVWTTRTSSARHCARCSHWRSPPCRCLSL